tara:strand:+ start:28645 stop:29550 length:906 start_codon:yes stop_codon:yes gene_type:complete
MIPQQAWSLGSAVVEGNRDALVNFWLAAPSDQLEGLWGSAFGQVTKELIGQLSPAFVFSPDQVSRRDLINQQLLQGGLQQPLAAQLLLAVFLYSPPGLMQVANARQNLPGWLAQAYEEIYLSGSVQAQQPAAVSPAQPPTPEFGAFPASLQELVGNRIHLNRILGLSNLYYIDPEDREISEELMDVRTQLVDLILAAPETSLESTWSGDFGDRYWAMVRSGIQNEPLRAEDEKRKQVAVRALNPADGGGFGTSGASNAFLVAMLYFVPGSMQVADADRQLPPWILQNYKQIFLTEPAQASA